MQPLGMLTQARLHTRLVCKSCLCTSPLGETHPGVTHHRAGLEVVWRWGLCLWPQGSTDPGVTHHTAGLEGKAVYLGPGQGLKEIAGASTGLRGPAMDQTWPNNVQRVAAMPTVAVVEVQLQMLLMMIEKPGGLCISGRLLQK